MTFPFNFKTMHLFPIRESKYICWNQKKWMPNGVWRDLVRVWGFPGSSDSEEATCNAGNLGLIPWSGRLPREGTDNPLQYSCLENPMGRGAWQAIALGISESDMTEQVNTSVSKSMRNASIFPLHSHTTKEIISALNLLFAVVDI